MAKISQAETQYNEIRLKGVTKKYDITQYELVQRIMQQGYDTEGKIWWFAYELMGNWKIAGEKYFMSYKASTRVCEMAHVMFGLVESRKTIGKLNVYALKSIIKKVK